MANYEPTQITLTSTTTDVTCNGLNDGTATMIATGGNGGYTYLWDDLLGQTTQIATGLSPGTYNCLVTDNNGCSVTGSVTITQPSPVLPGLVPVDATCFGLNNGSAQVFPTGVSGANFDVLFNGVSYGATNLVPLVPGFYLVEVINTLTGCSSGNQAFTIHEPADLTQTTTSVNLTCNGDLSGAITVVASGGTAPYSYTLLDAGGATINVNTAGVFTGLPAGDYTCVILDANSCPTLTTPTITLTEPNAIAPAMTVNAVSCNGLTDGSVTVFPTGGTGNIYSYLWSHDPANTTNTVSYTHLPLPTILLV